MAICISNVASYNGFAKEIVRNVINSLNSTPVVERVALVGDKYIVYLFQEWSGKFMFHTQLLSVGELVIHPAPFVTWNVTPLLPFNGFKPIHIHHSSGTEETIKADFNTFFDGDFVEHVELEHKQAKNGDKYFRAWVHFYQTSIPTEKAKQFYANLAANKQVHSIKIGSNKYWNIVQRVRPINEFEEQWTKRSEAMVDSLLA